MPPKSLPLNTGLVCLFRSEKGSSECLTKPKKNEKVEIRSAQGCLTWSGGDANETQPVIQRSWRWTTVVILIRVLHCRCGTLDALRVLFFAGVTLTLSINLEKK